MAKTASCYVLTILFMSLHFLSLSEASIFNNRCEFGWTFREGFCYQLSPTRTSFAAAQSLCESYGSALSSVQSDEENTFLLGIMIQSSSARMWIGFNDIYHEGDFQWLDGSPIVYTNWAISDINGDMVPEPNNGGKTGLSEDCTEMWRLWGHNGTWNDAPCSTRKNCMCKKEARPVVEPSETTTLHCPHSFETIVELGFPGEPVYWLDPPEPTSDIIGTSQIIRSHSPGSEFPIGLTRVKYTIYDNNNNTSSCNFSVTVLEVDTTPPTITFCPSDIGESKSNSNKQDNVVYWDTPSASDLSGIATLTSQTHSSGDGFGVGKHNVSYIFTDGSGNDAYCVFNIFVVEAQQTTASQGYVLSTVISIILGFIVLILLIYILAIYMRKKNQSSSGRHALINVDEEEAAGAGL